MTLRRPALRGIAGLALLSIMSCASPPGTGRVERGIGGTGSVADRGLGGTGAPSFAERGIGGTGSTTFIGAITGFGSIIVNGCEIASSRVHTIQMDGVDAPYTALRIGQLVRVIARTAAGGLSADVVTVEHEVIGQVEHDDKDGSFVVAGQRVRLLGTAQGKSPAIDQWVAVSGFRRSDGEIAASRLDTALPDETLVTGLLVRTDTGLRVGELAIKGRQSTALVGTRVRIRGHLAGDGLTANMIVPAPLLELQPGLDRAVLQTIASTEPGGLHLDQNLEVRRGPTLGVVPEDRPVIILLLSNPDGSLTAASTLDGGRSGESTGQGATQPGAQPGGPPTSASTSPRADSVHSGS